MWVLTPKYILCGELGRPSHGHGLELGVRALLPGFGWISKFAPPDPGSLTPNFGSKKRLRPSVVNCENENSSDLMITCTIYIYKLR